MCFAWSSFSWRSCLDSKRTLLELDELQLHTGRVVMDTHSGIVNDSLDSVSEFPAVYASDEFIDQVNQVTGTFSHSSPSYT